MSKLVLSSFFFCLVAITGGQGFSLTQLLPFLMSGRQQNSQQQQQQRPQVVPYQNQVNHNQYYQQNQPNQYQQGYAQQPQLPPSDPASPSPVYSPNPQYPQPNGQVVQASNNYQNPVPKSINQCSLLVRGRIPCQALSQYECQSKGCCFDRTYPTLPNCFRHPEMARNPAAPQYPPAGGYPYPNNQYPRPANQYPPAGNQYRPPVNQYQPGAVPYQPVPNQYQAPAAQQPGYPGQAVPTAQQSYPAAVPQKTSPPVGGGQTRCVLTADNTTCSNAGCCFNAASFGLNSRCVAPPAGMTTCPTIAECRLPFGPPVRCGAVGISSWACQAQGCCHHVINGAPMCYRKQISGPPAGSPQVVPKSNSPKPTATAETTTKLDIRKYLEEMEAKMNGKPTTRPSMLDILNGKASVPGLPPTSPPTTTTTAAPTTTQATTPALEWTCNQYGYCGYVPAQVRECYPEQCGVPVFVPPKNFTAKNTEKKKIVGGSRAYKHSHPWTVMIQKMEKVFTFGFQTEKTYICGATLICQQWIVTAAHCLDRQSTKQNTPDLDPNMYKIFIGRHAGWRADYGNHVQVFKGNQIERMVQHEKFTPGVHRGVITYDVALIKMRDRVFINNYAQPACLPKESPKIGTILFATGWGISRGKGPEPTELKQVGVEVQEQLICRKRVPKYGTPQGIICGGGEENHDTCTGDSGGPLVGSKQERTAFGQVLPKWYLYGLTSLGSPSCNTAQFDRQPALYTDIFYYLDWIKDTTKNCCA